MAKIGRSFREGMEELHAADPALRAEFDKLGPRYRAIAELLKARRRRKLTQAQLAERMGVSQGVLSRIESGNYSPKLETLAAAAQAMDYRVEVRFVEERGKTAA